MGTCQSRGAAGLGWPTPPAPAGAPGGQGQSPWFSSVVISCDERQSWGCEHDEDKGSGIQPCVGGHSAEGRDAQAGPLIPSLIVPSPQSQE